ncbi:uncharacterized protein LOC128622701 [Ictalurus furcatus]|uniref:uncharacterized protein LOC128622701 n=1 Tax=Ictalurus furcatus TaxID=66913 RepID=UPI00234FE994|nr:uncharacterized protein LOC128622701 [Ictalurus furcatus]
MAQNWTLREIACAAGLLVLSAGAGYCVYRRLRRGSVPPEHTQPPQEPENVLGDTEDTPSVLQSVDIRRYFLDMIRGPEHWFCWFKTTQTCYLDQEGFSYHVNTEDCFTGIQCVSGRVTEFISCHRMETVTLPLEDYVQPLKKVTCTYLFVGADGQSDAESESDSEEKEESPNFLELEVPFISSHLLERGVTDIGLKLCALREAFSTLLASIQNLNFLFVVGKKIVMRLAAANKQDVVGGQLAYASLIQFLKSPSNQESIVTELFEAQLHHYNFVDVFYELLLFGYVMNDSAPEACEGGFLESLYAFISMWNPDVWEPAAELYFTMLIDQLTVHCEVLFSQPLELYSDPAALAVSQLLWQHVPLMMDTLEKL